MPPKRGRPAKQAVAAKPAPAAASTPKRRGRPSAASIPAPTPASTGQQKKRGRPSKAPEEVIAPPVEEPASRRSGRATKKVDEAPPAPAPEPAAEPKKRGGRPRKEPATAPVVEPAVTLPKRRGRAPKTTEEAPATAVESSTPKRRGRAAKAALIPTVAEPISTPKRRGRPAKAAVDLNRVAGSPRVTKRKPATTKKMSPAAPAAPRMNPKVRSKLRTRVAPSPKVLPNTIQESKPKKRLGRPPKNVVAPTPTKKAAGRKTKGGRVTKPVAAKSVAKPAASKTSTVAKPRKRRGFTTLEVPDKHVKYLKDVLKGLLEQDEADAEAAEEEAEMADDEEEVPQEQMEPVATDDNSNIASKVAIAEALNEDVAGGAQEELIEEEIMREEIVDEESVEALLEKPISSSLPRSAAVTVGEHSSEPEANTSAPVITKQTIVELEYEGDDSIDEDELDGAFENEANGKQSTGSSGMVGTASSPIPSDLEAEGIDIAQESTQYNSLFDETPQAASTPAPPRASSAAKSGDPITLGNVMALAFP